MGKDAEFIDVLVRDFDWEVHLFTHLPGLRERIFIGIEGKDAK